MFFVKLLEEISGASNALAICFTPGRKGNACQSVYQVARFKSQTQIACTVKLATSLTQLTSIAI